MKKFRICRLLCVVAGILMVAAAGALNAQTNSGIVSGTVTDATGAVIPNAQVTLDYAVSGYTRTATTDNAGHFQFVNVPFNPYVLTVSSAGFQKVTKHLDVNATVAQVIPVRLGVEASATTISVEAPADLTENDPNSHTDIDRSMMTRLPIDSASSQLSAIVTTLSAGVAADSNGLMHGLGDHNEVSFSVDGQPITDQQSKVFSNQVPAAALQSMEIIEGAPPAEYGDKTSLVVVATTRSGQGITKPTGEISLSYGSFGTSNLAGDLAYGKENWGNFISVSGLQSGRFLDTPDFIAYHAKGNEANVFDRFDYQLSDVSSIHTNAQYTRSWFQTPNSYDTQYFFSQTGMTSGPTDQRSKIETVNLSPTYTRTFGTKSVLNFGPYFRRDGYEYYPSGNPLNDLGPIQQESVMQVRSLTNAGVHSDISYVSGHNNVKLGGMYQQTYLRENNTLGVVDPALNPPCVDTSGNPVTDPSVGADCIGYAANPNYNPVLAPYDLTRGGTTYTWHGRTAVKQLALYGQDQISFGNWLINAGIRGDIYNGLVIQRVAEPRLGVAYSIRPSGTVLRLSYARTQETPFNENLVLSSKGCYDPVLNAIFSLIGPCEPAPFNPGSRNEFHAGLQQAIGRHFVLDGEYIWKYTHNGYDFSVLGATPITFPIEWHNSKIPGWTLSGTLTPLKGLTARVTASSVAARFFNPQIGGVGATVGAPGGYPFRIDHDEKFNSNIHFQYVTPFRKSLYYSFNYRYDSGLVAGSVPCYNSIDPNSRCGATSIMVNGQPAIDLSGLTANEQFQAGLTCNGFRATQTTPIPGGYCLADQLTSQLVSIPAPNTEDDDHNPPRIQQRNLFDMELGDDNIVHFGANEHYKFGARLTAINVTNKYALYNFLSTFSGTHYVSPRSVTGELNFRF